MEKPFIHQLIRHYRVGLILAFGLIFSAFAAQAQLVGLEYNECFKDSAGRCVEFEWEIDPCIFDQNLLSEECSGPFKDIPQPIQDTSLPTSSENSDPLVVWHTLKDDLADIFANGDSGDALAKIKLVKFDSEIELHKALTAADHKGAGPDLIIGPDSLGSELNDLGLIDGFCLPGECPECNGKNPPRWCDYAIPGLDNGFNADFNISGLCSPVGDCPCETQVPRPRWCPAARLEGAVDIFQASLGQVIDEEVVPIGLPLGWDQSLILFNPEWFKNNDTPIPTLLDDLAMWANENPNMFYVDPGILADPSPDPMMPIIELLAKEDPSPQPSKPAIILTRVSKYNKLSQKTGPLFQLSLSDYQPTPVVYGIYVNSQTDNRDVALNLAYELATKDFQLHLFGKTGLLPTHGGAWKMVADETHVDLAE